MTIRGLVVAGLVIVFGYVFYGKAIFTPTMWPSQFFFSGVTLGIATAFFHNGHNRNGVAALLVWYVVSMTLISPAHNWWSYILNFASVVCIAGSVYLFYVVAQHPLLARRYRQIVASSILVGLANSLIVAILGLLHPQSTFAHPGSWFHGLYLNLEIGVLMGLLFGIGNLTSDTLERYFRSNHIVAS